MLLNCILQRPHLFETLYLPVCCARTGQRDPVGANEGDDPFAIFWDSVEEDIRGEDTGVG